MCYFTDVLLDHLQWMCTPDLGEGGYAKMYPPFNCPDYLEAAVHYIIDSIHPELEILTKRTPPEPRQHKTNPVCRNIRSAYG
jgi:hypothetical protein